jgi:hypothetical protein
MTLSIAGAALVVRSRDAFSINGNLQVRPFPKATRCPPMYNAIWNSKNLSYTTQSGRLKVVLLTLTQGEKGQRFPSHGSSHCTQTKPLILQVGRAPLDPATQRSLCQSSHSLACLTSGCHSSTISQDSYDTAFRTSLADVPSSQSHKHMYATTRMSGAWFLPLRRSRPLPTCI